MLVMMATAVRASSPPQNGLLFETTEQLEPQMTMLTQAQRLVQVLAGDPSLRGVVRALQFGLLGVQSGKLKLDNMVWPLTLASALIASASAASGRRKRGSRFCTVAV